MDFTELPAEILVRILRSRCLDSYDLVSVRRACKRLATGSPQLAGLSPAEEAARRRSLACFATRAQATRIDSSAFIDSQGYPLDSFDGVFPQKVRRGTRVTWLDILHELELAFPAGRSFAAGNEHSVVVTEDGAIATCGSNKYGQLGHQHLGTFRVQLDTLTPLAINDTRFSQVSCGLNFTAAVSEDGRLYTWGENVDGQLGLGMNTPSVRFPFEVTFPSEDPQPLGSPSLSRSQSRRRQMDGGSLRRTTSDQSRGSSRASAQESASDSARDPAERPTEFEAVQHHDDAETSGSQQVEPPQALSHGSAQERSPSDSGGLASLLEERMAFDPLDCTVRDSTMSAGGHREESANAPVLLLDRLRNSASTGSEGQSSHPVHGDAIAATEISTAAHAGGSEHGSSLSVVLPSGDRLPLPSSADLRATNSDTWEPQNILSSPGTDPEGLGERRLLSHSDGHVGREQRDPGPDGEQDSIPSEVARSTKEDSDGAGASTSNIVSATDSTQAAIAEREGVDEAVDTLPQVMATTRALLWSRCNKNTCVLMVSCGSGFMACVDTSGRCWTWGSGADYTLGTGDSRHRQTPCCIGFLPREIPAAKPASGARKSPAPVLVRSPSAGARPRVAYAHASSSLKEGLVFERAKAVACGARHVCWLSVTGKVFTNGVGTDGRLGHGDSEKRAVPTLVQALQDEMAVDADCGAHHTAIVTRSGKLFTFGYGQGGQLGHGDEERRCGPTVVESLADVHVELVRCGWGFTVALVRDRQCRSVSYPVSFGSGRFGQLGQGSLQTRTTHAPITFADEASGSPPDIASLAVGSHHAFAADATGTVYSWGKCVQGQLGFPSRKQVLRPTLAFRTVFTAPC